MGRGRNQPAVAAGKPGATTARRSKAPVEPDYEGWYADASRNDERIASARRTGDWVPGANGTERPVRTRSGTRLLWCWRPATGEHNYLNCDTDIILSDAEANAHLDIMEAVASRLQRPAAERKREAAKYLPQELKRAGYYNDINLQHFNAKTAVGSLFTRCKSLGRLIDTCVLQRGSLDGDDRDELVTLGADPAALIEPSTGVRYLKVIVDGESGIVDASQLAAATPVRVVRTKAGFPCSLVVDGARRQATFVGTLIIGPNRKRLPSDPEPSTEQCVWTAHPGFPVAPAASDVWPEGSVLSAGDVLAYFRTLGREDVALKIEQPERAVVTPAADPFSDVLGNRRGVEHS